MAMTLILHLQSPPLPYPHPANSRFQSRCGSPPGKEEAGGRRWRASPQPRPPGSQRVPSSRSRRGSGRRESAAGEPWPAAPASPRRPARRGTASLPAAVGPAGRLESSLPGWGAFCSRAARAARSAHSERLRCARGPGGRRVLPSRRREGPRGAGAARGRDAGRDGKPGSRCSGRGLRPAPRSWGAAWSPGARASLHCRGREAGVSPSPVPSVHREGRSGGEPE